VSISKSTEKKEASAERVERQQRAVQGVP